MFDIAKPRGTRDWFGNQAKNFFRLKKTFLEVSSLYGLEPIITPTFEEVSLFKRSIGQDSDIVHKEMYEFCDRGERKLALRPEGTASVLRLVSENKLLAQDGSRFDGFYFANFFRYERPQKGRYREFWQAGVERYGEFNNNLIYDTIGLIWDFFNRLQLLKTPIKIKYNFLGTSQERNSWKLAVVEYFKKPINLNQLSELSRSRLETNPLRILDDKIDSSLEIVKQAPLLRDFLNSDSKKNFEQIKVQLKSYANVWKNFIFEEATELVRGLDYYDNFVFEIINEEGLALGGGGEYSSFASGALKKSTRAFGFGLGVDRILDYYEQQTSNNQVANYILFVSESQQLSVDEINFLTALRLENLACYFDDSNRKIKRKLDSHNVQIKVVSASSDSGANELELIYQNKSVGKYSFTNQEELIKLIRKYDKVL